MICWPFSEKLARDPGWALRLALCFAQPSVISKGALLLQRTDLAAQICGMLAARLRDIDCDSVISPALGGIIVDPGSRPRSGQR